MINISLQDGKVILINNKIGTEIDCCCDNACPETDDGCPNLNGCVLVIVRKFPEGQTFVDELPIDNTIYLRGTCQIDIGLFNDLPIEQGGDEIRYSGTVSFDAECNRVLNGQVYYSVESCPEFNPFGFCLEVLVSIVCNN